MSVFALLVPASAAKAQRLLTLVPGVGQAASAGDLGPSIGPVPTGVQVDLDLLRSAPARLEVPTPDGSVLSAQRSVFEDRGGGDLMWSGGQPGAGYDTVVLTVEGGRLVGRFGAAAGGVYQIHAERDGRGGIAPIVGLQPDSPVPFCGVEAGAEHFHDGVSHLAAGALAADPPERVRNPQSHDRLDILVAYTATAAENWADRGGPLAAIQHAGDYMKMVFRNNNIPVEPHIVHVAQASAALDRAARDLVWPQYFGRRWLGTQLDFDGDLPRLRHVHRADLVHLFTGERAALLGACGRTTLLTTDPEVRSKSQYVDGWTTNHPLHCPDYAVTFVHELGHNLGANHDPANTGATPEDAFRPYAFGHANLDVMPSLGTAMSYVGQVEPFFSTPRIRPYGAVVGIAGERDQERLLQETVHIAVQHSDYLLSPDAVPAPPSDLRVRFDGAAAHATWRDNAPDADGYEMEIRSLGVAGPVRTPGSGRSFLMVDGRSEAVLPLESTEPGAQYRFLVRATKGDARSLRSNVAFMVVPGDPPEAPSDVSTTFTGSVSNVKVRWTDNSDDELGFDVQLLEDGEVIHRSLVAADSERTRFWASEVAPRAGGEYGVRVFAYNWAGYSASSEVATFRWEYTDAPGPVTGLSVRATGPTTVRVTWNAAPAAHYVTAFLPSWEDTRFLTLFQEGAIWTDFEGLPRGGRYAFRIEPVQAIKGLPSFAYLTLGERGASPRAPSDLTWVLEGDRVRLSWKDNSSDELGFEVQYALVGSDGHPLAEERGAPTWTRLLTVPADTESATSSSDDPAFDDRYRFRVFAYNDRGYSVGSPRVQERPFIRGLTATAGPGEVRLGWHLHAPETVTGIQVRWKASTDLPFDDAVDLPASARAYTVTGLKNVTEYTFNVRYVTAFGVGPPVIARATPRGERAGSCQAGTGTLCLQNSRFQVQVNWRNADGESGVAQVVEDRTNDSGLFRFFGPDNWEILIKVLDGCGINGRMWVLGASTTDLGYLIRVTDTLTKESRTYTNEPGQPAPAIVDTKAFSVACVDGAVP